MNKQVKKYVDYLDTPEVTQKVKLPHYTEETFEEVSMEGDLDEIIEVARRIQ